MAGRGGEPHNRAVIDALRKAGVRWPEHAPSAAVAAGPLAGLTFVLTGTLSSRARSSLLPASAPATT